MKTELNDSYIHIVDKFGGEKSLHETKLSRDINEVFTKIKLKMRDGGYLEQDGYFVDCEELFALELVIR